MRFQQKDKFLIQIAKEKPYSYSIFVIQQVRRILLSVDTGKLWSQNKFKSLLKWCHNALCHHVETMIEYFQKFLLERHTEVRFQVFVLNIIHVSFLNEEREHISSCYPNKQKSNHRLLYA